MRPRSRIALAFSFLLLACLGSQAGQIANGLLPLSSLTVSRLTPEFGGLSGLEVSADGRAFEVVSDRAHLFTGEFRRQDDRLIGVNLRSARALVRGDGTAFQGVEGDSEGLARRPGGPLLVSFEGIPRLARIPKTAPGPARVTRFDRPDAFRRIPENAAFEALAASPSGQYLVVQENTRDPARDFPVWRFSNGSWDQPFSIPRQDRFLPVGADFGPDGLFYLLERRFRGIFGFESRIRRFDIRGDTLGAGTTLLKTSPGRHGNLEGIAIWRDSAGRIRVTMVADDNFFALQVTEFVEYALP